MGTVDRPRLAVYRSASHIYAQVIDDAAGKTLVASSSLVIEKPKDVKGKNPVAEMVGRDLAERAKARGVSKVVFDRRAYRYHGRVKALADGARQGGLEF